MLGGGGIRQTVNLGTVQVRLTGMVRGDVADKDAAALAAPTVAEATAALNRTARVTGADELVRVGSDYRRHAIAWGPLSTRTIIEVQAWGTAVRHAQVVEETETAEEREATKRKEAEEAARDQADKNAEAADVERQAEPASPPAEVPAEQAAAPSLTTPEPVPVTVAQVAQANSGDPEPA